MDFPRPARQLTLDEEKRFFKLPYAVSVRRNGNVSVYLFEPKKSERVSEAANRDIFDIPLFMESDGNMERVISNYGEQITIDRFKKMAGSLSRQKMASEGSGELEYEIYRVKQIK